MVPLFLAVAILLAIILVSLRVESLWLKILSFVAIAALDALQLLWTGHGAALIDVYWMDYLPFIAVPICTVLVAGLGLFDVIVVGNGKRLGWFLLLVCPVVGNFGTTWALVPVAVSLLKPLRAAYPDRWREILITLAMFGMNFLALGTLAADPPQAYWAIKASEEGVFLPFLFPATHFWPYLACTMVLYALVLKRLGVEFGSLTSLLAVRPESWPRILLGMGVVGCVSLAITHLQGHAVGVALGIVCLVVGLMSLLFRKEGGLFAFSAKERTHALEWSLETGSIFLAFFAVVVQAHLALHELNPPALAMIPVVAGMTAWADNAAAFAVGYPVYADMPPVYMVWFNLFPAVVFGGSTPLGNGPQIIFLLVIMVGSKQLTPHEVFSSWFHLVRPLLVYLLVWIVGMATLIHQGYEPTPAVQGGVGVLSLLAWTGASRLLDMRFAPIPVSPCPEAQAVD